MVCCLFLVRSKYGPNFVAVMEKLLCEVDGGVWYQIYPKQVEQVDVLVIM